MYIDWRSKNWRLNLKEISILGYLDEVGVDRLVVVGVDALDDVDTDDDVEIELVVDKLQRKRKIVQWKESFNNGD